MNKGFLKEASKGKEYSDIEIKRFSYVEEKPYDFEEEDYVWNAVELTDVNTSERLNRNGKPYISRFARLVFYNDDDQVKMQFPFNLWNDNINQSTGDIKFKINNPVTNLIKAMLDDDENNVFTVDYVMLQNAIDEINGIIIKPTIISNRNNFTLYGFKVVSIDF